MTDTPQNVRNFWINSRIDGLARNLSSGPAQPEGGMHTLIAQRHDGRLLLPKLEVYSSAEGPELYTRISLSSYGQFMPEGTECYVITPYGNKIPFGDGNLLILHSRR